MDSKMMLLVGVMLLSGWGSVCVAGFGDEEVPLLHDYCDGNNQQLSQVQVAPAYQSCPEFSAFQEMGSLPPAHYFPQTPDYLTGNGFSEGFGIEYDSVFDSKMKSHDVVLALRHEYFTKQPAIETEKLILCPLDVEHADALNPLFGQYTKEFFAALVAQRLTGSVVPWVVYLKGSNDGPGKVIGYCGFDAVTNRNEGLIVCEFLQDFCGKEKYFDQAMFAILNEGFVTLNLDKIILDKRSNVSGAQRVRNLGFTSSMLYDRCAGKYAEIRRFAMTREQYFKLNFSYEANNSNANNCNDEMVCDSKNSTGNEISLSGDSKPNAFVAWVKQLFTRNESKLGYEKLSCS